MSGFRRGKKKGKGERNGEISGKEGRERTGGKCHGLSHHIAGIHLNVFTLYERVDVRFGKEGCGGIISCARWHSVPLRLVIRGPGKRKTSENEMSRIKIARF